MKRANLKKKLNKRKLLICELIYWEKGVEDLEGPAAVIIRIHIRKNIEIRKLHSVFQLKLSLLLLHLRLIITKPTIMTEKVQS
jgi:hypothetical protein